MQIAWRSDAGPRARYEAGRRKDLYELLKREKNLPAIQFTVDQHVRPSDLNGIDAVKSENFTNPARAKSDGLTIRTSDI